MGLKVTADLRPAGHTCVYCRDRGQGSNADVDLCGALQCWSLSLLGAKTVTVPVCVEACFIIPLQSVKKSMYIKYLYH